MSAPQGDGGGGATTGSDNTANNPTANNPTANNPTANNPTANNPTANNTVANDTAADNTAGNVTAANINAADNNNTRTPPMSHLDDSNVTWAPKKPTDPSSFDPLSWVHRPAGPDTSPCEGRSRHAHGHDHTIGAFSEEDTMHEAVEEDSSS
ncbi:hypothetical protein M409DRAFT_22665 [Zasmidium cellare ATCC 36951]|uniref:Uncharacterized protein n=1 Tax=Zasmidium cellare ATCC 36951 TaxID=1080233 RepID=A0A6A6CLZ2_ZASCE|nr:uncharacterized protein M409DRAFT_22665 [Zasmidium cellare ATCC 36951]KAF2167238.1 hypothetical protein M409DRAFT_22665 [Zasmidium cellare ATCC 36951]